MSYSFSVKAPTKAEALVRVTEELAKVVTAQPVHETDRDQAQGAAELFVYLLADDDTKDVEVNVSGSLGWENTADPAKPNITNASVNVTAYLTPRS